MEAKLIHTAEVIRGLKEWEPHVKQAEVLFQLFYQDIRSIFIEAGRKFGKTELAAYILWRWCQTFPNCNGYYIAPLQTQAKEIIWADPRLQTFGPRSWLLDGDEGINNTDMRLKFKNGSFIKVDGSDNYEKHRGTRPGILVYEEFKDHRKEFRIIMRPNLAVYNAPEIFIGTPPEDPQEDSEYVATMREHQKDPTKLYFHAPTSANPLISRKWLAEERERLYARGEGDVWEREYEARHVRGGASKIFPMLNDSIIKPHGQLMHSLSRDLKKLQWISFADPAGASCFAVLFLAYNPYTKHLYALDEVYEKKQQDMTVRVIGQKIVDTIQELAPRPRCEWRLGYDEAETWFANEMLDHFEEGLEPSQKSRADKISGLTLIKDILLTGNLTISDRCVHFFKEMDQYKKDENGKIPKKNDHLIDCFRYALDALHFSLVEEIEYHPEKDPDWRGARIEDDFPGMFDDSFDVG